MNDRTDSSADFNSLNFMRSVETKAGVVLWALAGSSSLALICLQFMIANASSRPGNLTGRLIGAIVFPLVVSWLASKSGHASTQRAKVKVFTATSLLLLALGVSALFAAASTR